MGLSCTLLVLSHTSPFSFYAGCHMCLWDGMNTLTSARVNIPTTLHEQGEGKMLDSAAIGVIVGLVGLGLTTVWLVRNERQKKELTHVSKLAGTIAREHETNAELERQKLLQRQHEQQYRETRDFFKMMGWLREQFSEED